MHIAYLTHRVPYPPNKGEKIRTFHQIKYLAEEGYKVSVFSPTSGPNDINSLNALKDQYASAVYHAPQRNKLALLQGLLTNQALSISSFYTKALQSQFDDFLESHTVDAIVATSSSMAEYIFRSTSLAKLSSRPRLVMDFMDLDSDKWLQYQSIKPFPMSLIYARESRLISQYEKRIHQQFDAALFISQAEVDLFLKHNADLGKLHVIGNGMDTTTFRPSPTPKPTSGPIIIFTGVMDYLPNEDAVTWFVNEGWATLKARHPDARFVIAGMNPSPGVKALSRHPGVEVTGFVDDIMAYYDMAHIFVAPFRLARGVQNKVLQAFACGIPTITTSLGCEGIHSTPGKNVLVADNITATIEKIDWVITHPQEAKHIADEAVDLVKNHYSWESKLAPFKHILTNS